MKSKSKLGFTLTEVLASIVILGIVVGSVMIIFTQNKKSTTYNTMRANAIVEVENIFTIFTAATSDPANGLSVETLNNQIENYYSLPKTKGNTSVNVYFSKYFTLSSAIGDDYFTVTFTVDVLFFQCDIEIHSSTPEFNLAGNSKFTRKIIAGGIYENPVK